MKRIPGTELDIFPLNLGANSFGWTADEETSFAILDAFVAAGGNFLDTADSYVAWVGEGGESEQIIGNWLAARGNRSQIVLATKFEAHPKRRGLSEANAKAALADSLERLQTDYIDLYYLHNDDAAVSIKDQVQTAHDLVQSGQVRHIGLSNHSPERMREWFEMAQRAGLTVPVAIQPGYNLVRRRQFEQDYAPLAAEFDAAVFPYSALASGFLTGKYRTQEDADAQARGGAVAAYLNDEGFAVVDALAEIAGARGVEPATVALAWLRARGILAPIASVSVPEQLPSLMAAATLELSAAEVARLNEVSQLFA